MRENAAMSALEKFRTGLLMTAARVGWSATTLNSLAVKAASLTRRLSPVRRQPAEGRDGPGAAVRAAARVADEPTQGVDVGARAEIYRILREVSASGIPVIVESSDAKELEGLCDQVIVMSRGHVVETLRGDDITEARWSAPR